jgi:hypothetical protein
MADSDDLSTSLTELSQLATGGRDLDVTLTSAAVTVANADVLASAKRVVAQLSRADHPRDYRPSDRSHRSRSAPP